MASEIEEEASDVDETGEGDKGAPKAGRLKGLLKRVLVGLGLLLLYGLVATGSTWPLALTIGESLPLGTYEDATVPYTMAWGLWWTAEALSQGVLGYFDAPIFHPMENAFALSESVPFLGAILAPLFSLDLSLALVHNVGLFIVLVLNGFATYGLLKRLRLPVGFAFGRRDDDHARGSEEMGPRTSSPSSGSSGRLARCSASRGLHLGAPGSPWPSSTP